MTCYGHVNMSSSLVHVKDILTSSIDKSNNNNNNYK